MAGAEHVPSRRPGGETEGECGKRESCHPKKQVSGDRGQVSVTRWRGKGRSWALGVGSWGRADAKVRGVQSDLLPCETFDYEYEHRFAEHEHEGGTWKT